MSYFKGGICPLKVPIAAYQVLKSKIRMYFLVIREFCMILCHYLPLLVTIVHLGTTKPKDVDRTMDKAGWNISRALKEFSRDMVKNSLKILLIYFYNFLLYYHFIQCNDSKVSIVDHFHGARNWSCFNSVSRWTAQRAFDGCTVSENL